MRFFVLVVLVSIRAMIIGFVLPEEHWIIALTATFAILLVSGIGMCRGPALLALPAQEKSETFPLLEVLPHDPFARLVYRSRERVRDLLDPLAKLAAPHLKFCDFHKKPRQFQKRDFLSLINSSGQLSSPLLRLPPPAPRSLPPHPLSHYTPTSFLGGTPLFIKQKLR